MTTSREYGHSLVAEQLIEAVRGLMLAATTTAVDDEQMIATTDKLRRITESLNLKRKTRGRRIPYDEAQLERINSGEAWQFFPYLPLGIPQDIRFIDGEAISEINLSALHEGPPNMLHGGFSAAILDALLGALVMVEATPAVTASLKISFLRPTPLDTTITVRGRIHSQSERRITAQGSIEVDGVPTVTAEGLFVPFKMTRQS